MDGDQTTVKAVFSNEANKELGEYLNSKPHYIAVNGINTRVSTNETVQVIYSLTKIDSETKLIDPIFK